MRLNTRLDGVRFVTWKTAVCMMSLAMAMGIPMFISHVVAQEIIASDDTWVREDNADSNRNGNDQMNLRTDLDADDNDAILLRFDTSSLSDPVANTTLRLFWQRTSGDSTGKIMKVYGLNETDPDETTWAEDVVTYNNAPGMIPDGLNPTEEVAAGHTEDDIYDQDTANLTFLGQMEVVAPGAVINEAFDFSSGDLDAFINADTNDQVTLLLFRDQTTSSHQLRYWPKEPAADTAPRLVVPEPASIALLGIGGLLLLRRRR